MKTSATENDHNISENSQAQIESPDYTESKIKIGETKYNQRTHQLVVWKTEHL